MHEPFRGHYKLKVKQPLPYSNYTLYRTYNAGSFEELS